MNTLLIPATQVPSGYLMVLAAVAAGVPLAVLLFRAARAVSRRAGDALAVSLMQRSPRSRVTIRRPSVVEADADGDLVMRGPATLLVMTRSGRTRFRKLRDAEVLFPAAHLDCARPDAVLELLAFGPQQVSLEWQRGRLAASSVTFR